MEYQNNSSWWRKRQLNSTRRHGKTKWHLAMRNGTQVVAVRCGNWTLTRSESAGPVQYCNFHKVEWIHTMLAKAEGPSDDGEEAKRGNERKLRGWRREVAEKRKEKVAFPVILEAIVSPHRNLGVHRVYQKPAHV